MLAEAGNSRAGLQADIQGSAGEGERAAVTAPALGGHGLPAGGLGQVLELAVTQASFCSQQEPAASTAACQTAEFMQRSVVRP